METWRKRITAITFGNGRKLISPRCIFQYIIYNFIRENLFTFVLWGFSELKRTRRGREMLREQKGLPPMSGGTISLQHSTSASSRPRASYVSTLTAFSRPSRWEWNSTVCSHDPSLCFHIDIKPSIRGPLSSSWQRLGSRLWHTFNY